MSQSRNERPANPLAPGPQEPVMGTITVQLSDADWRHARAVRELCKQALLRTPSLNGADIRVVQGDFTSVDGPELAGAELLAAVHDICRAG